MTISIDSARFGSRQSRSVDQGGVPAPKGDDPTLKDLGGAVLTKPTVTNIYLGDYFNTPQGKSDAQHNDAFSREFATSDLAGVIRQYRGATLPSFAGSVMVPGASPARMTQVDVQNFVRRQLAAGTVPGGTEHIYNVVLPPKTVLVADNGATSLDGMGGFHGSIEALDHSDNPAYYSVIAYGDEDNGANLDGNSQDNISVVESHEWSEAATDPDVNSPSPNRGMAFANDHWGEVGDLGVFLLPTAQVWTKDKAGFAVQREWSNLDRLFEIAPR